MKGFGTLFWLELRRSGVWALVLTASLAFWAWGIYQARDAGAGERADVCGVLLVMAAGIGALVLALMIGRLRGETRGGQYQVLLLTPPSGLTHIAARFSFALATALVYYVALGGLVCWALSFLGIVIPAGAAARLVLALPLYCIAVGIAPLLAWTLLLMTFISAYRISGSGWIPGTVMVLGSLFGVRWLVEGFDRIAYSLPSWPLFTGLAYPDSANMLYSVRPDGREVLTAANGTLYLPQEPVWIMLGLSLAFLAVASRIWKEVEA